MLKCKKCGHQWYNRVVSPSSCPKCQTRQWSSHTIYSIPDNEVPKSKPKIKLDTT